MEKPQLPHRNYDANKLGTVDYWKPVHGTVINTKIEGQEVLLDFLKGVMIGCGVGIVGLLTLIIL